MTRLAVPMDVFAADDAFGADLVDITPAPFVV